MRVASSGAMLRPSDSRVTQALAWRQRKLDFSHATLGQVAEEFNRYNERQIRIEDPGIKTRVMNGVFNADEPEALVKFLAGEPDISIENKGKDVYIRRVAAR